jgi:hypothetical protein
VRALMEADRRTDLFEWVLGRMLLRHLDRRLQPAGQRRPRYYALNQLAGACNCLLSMLAYTGHADSESAARAFDQAAGSLGIGPMKLWPVEQCTLEELDRALESLAEVTPKLKRRVLEACIICIGSDGQVTEEEAELLRAVADGLDCPVPPVVAGQRVE